MLRPTLMEAWGPHPPGGPHPPCPGHCQVGVVEQEAEEATFPPSHGVGHIKGSYTVLQGRL